MAHYKTVKPATFTLPVGLLEELDAMSKDLGKKKTAIVAEALEMYMDYQDLKIAKERLEENEEMELAEFFESLEK